MTEAQSSETLEDRRHVTVVLRLVVDRRGRLVYGELIDEAAQARGRFVGWRGLTRTVQRWLVEQAERGHAAG